MRYDIRNHEWCDNALDEVIVNNDYISIWHDAQYQRVRINTSDAIAIAKHFELTTNDLGDE